MVAFEGHAPGDILGVGIEAPVLVDDDDPGELPAALGPGRIGLHRSALDGILDVSRFEARVVLGHELGAGLRAFERRERHRRDGRPAGERGELRQELAAVHPAPGVFARKALRNRISWLTSSMRTFHRSRPS
ncbi:MAG: hypothetical protein MZV70_70835 [Desulfobacterales bacterium]|nr:hypothetical protein [Desulfobacterales bacterium]